MGNEEGRGSLYQRLGDYMLVAGLLLTAGIVVYVLVKG
jgi:hypothetical protein